MCGNKGIALAMHNPTRRAQVRVLQRRARTCYLIARLRLFLAELRYHLLCFKHFGWVTLAIAILKTPEHLKAIGVALFTRPRSPSDPGRPVGGPR